MPSWPLEYTLMYTATSLFKLLVIARHGDTLFSFPFLNDLQHSHLKRTVVTISTDASFESVSRLKHVRMRACGT